MAKVPDKAKKLKDNLDNMAKGLKELENEIKPLFDFNNLSKQLKTLKTVTSASLSKMDVGETCMHGNSWHSECSDCNDINTIDDVFLLVEELPNDAELGAAVRELYREIQSDSDKTGE